LSRRAHLRAWDSYPQATTARRLGADPFPRFRALGTAGEREFRIVYIDHDKECEAKDFAIDLSCIRKITMNPWMPKPLLKSVRATIQSVKGCRELRVSHTTLLENEKWKRAARASEPPSKPARSKLRH